MKRLILLSLMFFLFSSIASADPCDWYTDYKTKGYHHPDQAPYPPRFLDLWMVSGDNTFDIIEWEPEPWTLQLKGKTYSEDQLAAMIEWVLKKMEFEEQASDITFYGTGGELMDFILDEGM